MRRNSIKILVSFCQYAFFLSCGQLTEKTAVEKIQILNHGVHIDYTDTGKGDSTLLFVHGWCLNKSYWTSQAEYFKKRFRIVAVDLPGFGMSGKNRSSWTTQSFGADVDSVISGLNLKNVILVGHSMAGDIVLEAALHSPERVIGIVGVDNFKGFGASQTDQEKEEYAKVMIMLRNDFTNIATQYFNESLFSKTTPDSIKKRILNDVRSTDSVIAVAAMEPGDMDEVKELSKWEKKLFLINSNLGTTDTAGFVKNHIPFQIYYINGTGHFPMVENPPAFNASLEKCIQNMGK